MEVYVDARNSLPDGKRKATKPDMGIQTLTTTQHRARSAQRCINVGAAS